MSAEQFAVLIEHIRVIEAQLSIICGCVVAISLIYMAHTAMAKRAR